MFHLGKVVDVSLSLSTISTLPLFCLFPFFSLSSVPDSPLRICSTPILLHRTSSSSDSLVIALHFYLLSCSIYLSSLLSCSIYLFTLPSLFTLPPFVRTHTHTRKHTHTHTQTHTYTHTHTHTHT